MGAREITISGCIGAIVFLAWLAPLGDVSWWEVVLGWGALGFFLGVAAWALFAIFVLRQK